MDNQRENILVCLGLFMVMKYIIISIMTDQKTVIYQHNIASMMMAFLLFGNKERVVWKFDQPNEYVSQDPLGLYNTRMFQGHLRVSRPVVTYLCHLIGPILSKQILKLWFRLGGMYTWLVIIPKIKNWKETMNEIFLPYKLIEDVAYPMHPCFYLPCKEENTRFSREKKILEFYPIKYLNSSWMYIWHLKEEMENIVEKFDIPLQTILNIITVCLYLHNLCIIHGNEFNLNWAKSAQEDMKRTSFKNAWWIHEYIYILCPIFRYIWDEKDTKSKDANWIQWPCRKWYK